MCQPLTELGRIWCLSSYASQLHTEVQHTVGAQLDDDLFISSLVKAEWTLGKNSLTQQEGSISMAAVPSALALLAFCFMSS